MPLYPGSAAGGFTSGMNDAIDNDQRRARAAMEMQSLEAGMAEKRRQAAALPLMGALLRGVSQQPAMPEPEIMAPPYTGMSTPGQSSTIGAPPKPKVKGMPQQSDADTITAAQDMPMPTVDVIAKPPKAKAPAAPRLDMQTLMKTLSGMPGVTDEMIPVVLEGLRPLVAAENKMEIDHMRVENLVQRQADLAFYRESKLALDKQMKEMQDETARYKIDTTAASRKESLAQRVRVSEARIAMMARAEERMMSKENRLRVTQDPQMAALKLKVMTLRNEVGQGLNFLNNATDKAQIEQMTDRVAAKQEQLDSLLKTLDDHMETLLVVPEPAKTQPKLGKPSGVDTTAPGKPAAALAAARPPMPTDPAYDYKYDEAGKRWLRAKKQ